MIIAPTYEQKSVTFDTLPKATEDLLKMIESLTKKIDILEESIGSMRGSLNRIAPENPADKKPHIVNCGKIFGLFDKSDVFYLKDLKDEESVLLHKNNPNSPITNYHTVKNWIVRKNCPYHGGGNTGRLVYLNVGELYDWLMSETIDGEQARAQICRKGVMV